MGIFMSFPFREENFYMNKSNAVRQMDAQQIEKKLPLAANDLEMQDQGISDIMETIEKSKMSGHPEVVRTHISPVTAAWLLARNDSNRTVSEPTVIKYSDDMTNDRWMENGGGVSLSICGYLNNGQHRCFAVKRSGMTVTMNVTVGLTRESRATNDIGNPRTISAILAMAGVENSSLVGPMAKMIMGWEITKTPARRKIRENSMTSIQDYIEKDPSIGKSAAFVRTLKVPKAFMSKPQIGFFHNILTKHNPDKSEAFLRALVTGNDSGMGLMMNDPRMVARERLVQDNKILNHAERMELVFRAWNAWIQGRELTQTRVKHVIPELA